MGAASATDVFVRPATAADAPAISAIYNHYVQVSACTYDEEPERLKDRLEWLAAHGQKHPALVAVLAPAGEDETVVGWASLSPFRSRCAYRNTVENSVYVHHAHHGCGIGSLLLEHLIHRARELGHHTIIAGIDGGQAASIAFHRKHGFMQVAHFREVGYKFGGWRDVVFMQRMLNDPGADQPRAPCSTA